MRTAWASVALVALLASTWLLVGAALQTASTAVVSAGRTGFTVVGLLALTWWSVARSTAGQEAVRGTPGPSAAPAYRWWQVAALALTGVTAYTVLSTAAIGFAGPALPPLVIALTPAVVLVGESVLARKRPAVVTMVGTAIAVAGAILYVVPRLDGSYGRHVAVGVVCAITAMLSMAFYGVYFARGNRGYHGAMAPRLLPIFAVGAVPLVIWAMAGLSAGEAASWTAVGLLAVLGVVIYVPAYVLQHRLILTAGPSYAALLGLAVPPLVGTASAMLHLADLPAATQVIGTALTLLGMGLVLRRPRRLSASAE